MELEVRIRDSSKTIQVKNPKGRHQRQYLKKVSALGDKDKPNPDKMAEFLEWRDKTILELCPELQESDLDEMDMSDLNKIVAFIVSKFKLLGDVEKN